VAAGLGTIERDAEKLNAREPEERFVIKAQER
jgi:hypothetical protein